MRSTHLDRQWEALMALCRKEAELEREDKHPKLAKVVSDQLDQLARDMGFSEERIRQREFRAERDGPHIIRFLVD